MARLGESSVKTKDQFAALVLGLDVSTKGGADLYTSLMAVAPAFAKVADAVTTAVSNVTSALDSLISSTASAAAAYRQASQAIADTLSHLRSDVVSPASNLAISRAQFGTGVASAQSGDIAALNNLPKLAQDFATASLAASSTVQLYNRDLIGIMGGLASAGAVADTQASLYDVRLEFLTRRRPMFSGPD
jgi:hypothetical protein